MSDPPERSTRGHSVTEPSTPSKRVKLYDERIEIHSQPSSSSRITKQVKLPPHELPDITALLGYGTHTPGSISQRRWSGRISAPSTSHRETSGRQVMSPAANTPTKRRDTGSRDSQRQQSRRSSRRSSIITDRNGVKKFDPAYVGPITIDYLRFLCKVSIEEKANHAEHVKREESVPPQESSGATNEVHDESGQVERRSSLANKSRTNSGVTSPSDRTFEHSLPLPDETFQRDTLDAPFEAFISFASSASRFQSRSPATANIKSNEATKEKPFSYLERILANHSSKRDNAFVENRARRSEQIAEDGSHSASIRGSANSSTSRFVIHDSYLASTGNLEDKVGQITPDSKSQDQNIDIERTNTASLDVSESATGTLHPNPEEDASSSNNMLQEAQRDYNNTDDALIHDSSAPVRSGTFNNEDIPIFPEVNNDFHPSRSDSSSPQTDEAGLTSKHEFTLNDDLPDPFQSHFQEDNLDENPELAESEAKNEYNTESKSTTNIKHSLRSKPREGVVPNASISLGNVRNLTRLLEVERNTGAKVSKRGVLRRKMPLESLRMIQDKSSDFLKSLVSDLEAYSMHRTGSYESQINISDVFLYLNRIKFGRRETKQDEIENISRLAQDFLPLELLIELHDNLMKSRDKPTKASSESVSGFSESDSQSEAESYYSSDYSE
ncbi:Piso0_005075 [Millerozyma farinosa CBS 7064]|uniref:Piso0_005075 protein n=1 Tax=Pichia sorbitophila (strain ATCC MYA-4447 / BCRC 22081 / CBS 7064 / NBRC 10061 / NRRL Y-12695) TaxID=559304 RepID=G8Y460_PICSO|nr:Piso0_005075 [Millerozyma farinosa CBS 7064]